MSGGKSATDITVLETLHWLDNEFGAVAAAIENGEFALWVGSGISRQAPSLGDIISRAIEFLRIRAVDPATKDKFEPAFKEALKLSEIGAGIAEPHFNDPFPAWPDNVREPIVKALWNKYSKLLDIRIKHEPEDFMLWDAVDIREAFKDPAPPACEHLCIAILILEGAVNEIASANWDGFIEAAVTRLAGSINGNLQVVVDPAHLRDPPAKARLLKFHGCIVHATEAPDDYRRFLTASEMQINAWPHNPGLKAMRTEVISAATKRKALMTGLSLQDGNLQSVFSLARFAHPWPWPCAPKAQGHVFCTNAIGDGQRAMLKMVYAANYNAAVDEIEKSALLRAWPEQVLLALVFKTLTDKLGVLLQLRLAKTALAAEVGNLIADLHKMRDTISAGADTDRTAFLNGAIELWSRMISLFRTGLMPARADGYEILSTTPVGQLAGDMNVQAAGFGELGIALALLEHGRQQGLWTLAPPDDSTLTAGAIASVASWPGAVPRPIFLVHSAATAVKLKEQGAFANDNAIVIHADDAWAILQSAAVDSARTRTKARRTGRIATRHVSIAAMVASEADLGALRDKFISEVTL